MKPKQLALVRHKASPARTRAGRWRGAFLKALARSASITVAARAAHVSRQTVYTKKNEDPNFRAALEDALDQSLDCLEAEIYSFAMGLKNCDAGTASARVKAAEIQLRLHGRMIDKSQVAFAGKIVFLPAKAKGDE